MLSERSFEIETRNKELAAKPSTAKINDATERVVAHR